MKRTRFICYWGIIISMSLPCCSPSEDLHSSTKDDMIKIEPEKFGVSILTKVNNVQIEQPFDVTVRVANNLRESQSITVLQGRWIEHWKITSPHVDWVGGFQAFSISDQIAPVKLKPGEAYEKTAQMAVGDVPGEQSPSTVSFQVVFTPIGEEKIYWSNKVVLRIKPGKHK